MQWETPRIDFWHPVQASTFSLLSSSEDKGSLSTYWVFMDIFSTYSSTFNEEILVKNKEKFISDFKNKFIGDKDKIHHEFDMSVSSVSVSTHHNYVNSHGNFIAEIDNLFYSNLIVGHAVLGFGVILGLMILRHICAAFYDICACDMCPSLSWMLGCDQRGYTAVKGNEPDDISSSYANIRGGNVMTDNHDDEEKVKKSKRVALSTEIPNLIEMRFKTLERALEIEKLKRTEKEVTA